MSQPLKISQLSLTDDPNGIDQFVLNQQNITKRTSLSFVRSALAAASKFGVLRLATEDDVNSLSTTIHNSLITTMKAQPQTITGAWNFAGGLNKNGVPVATTADGTLTPDGAWVSTKAYDSRILVTHNNQLWVSTVATLAGDTPGVSNKWHAIPTTIDDTSVKKSATGEASGLLMSLTFSGVQAGNSGTMGIKLERNRTDGGPTGITLRSPFVAETSVGPTRDQWDVVTLDAGTNDLVLFGDHWAKGEDSANRRFGDQFRIAHGAHAEFGYSVGLQSTLRRFEISSHAEDNVNMQNLLLLTMNTGSPVVYPLRIIEGALGSSTDVLTVNRNGNVISKGFLEGAGLISRGTLASEASMLKLINTETGGRQYRLASGMPGTLETGFALVDHTANIRRIAVQAGGNVRLGQAAQGGDLALAATDGFVVVPQMLGKPTGVPTAFAGTSGGAMVWNRSGARMCVYVNGVGWFESPAYTQIV